MVSDTYERRTNSVIRTAKALDVDTHAKIGGNGCGERCRSSDGDISWRRDVHASSLWSMDNRTRNRDRIWRHCQRLNLKRVSARSTVCPWKAHVFQMLQVKYPWARWVKSRKEQISVLVWSIELNWVPLPRMTRQSVTRDKGTATVY